MSTFQNPREELIELFGGVIAETVRVELGQQGREDVATYLTELVARFLHTDRIFAICDAEGRRVMSIAEMMAEGDISMNADSFEREREVHRHIGDFILFWTGAFPEYLKRMKLENEGDLIWDYPSQAKASYHLVSTFDYPPHDQEAPTFRKLSDSFEDYAFCFRRSFERVGHA